MISTTNTCTALGVSPLNGTSRTSKYLDIKEDKYTQGSTDALKILRTTVGVIPGDANFDTQIRELADFYETYFQLGDPTSPADKDANNNPITILWRPNYYIHGLTSTVLNANTWLGQTKGWTDQNGAAGTVEWQDDEVLSVD